MAKKKTPQPRAQTELVFITGLSGSGKGTVLKALEDLGLYSVDNLPIDLIAKFTELAENAPNIRKAAIVVDIREGAALERFPALYRRLRGLVNARLIFLEADDSTLMRRFSETRRPHPLGIDRSVGESIQRERESLEPIRRLADPVINTSKFNVHELRDTIHRTFQGQPKEAGILVQVSSFGYRHGVPGDSDLVFDVRFLPNPNYIPAFKNLTGKNPGVARYIRGFPQTTEFIARITDLLIYLLPHYISEGKVYLTIAFGCTGGHHRSVMIAHDIASRLEKAGYRVKETHRDINK
jgi:UPF0042 nucleotide-binding protein